MISIKQQHHYIRPHLMPNPCDCCSYDMFDNITQIVCAVCSLLFHAIHDTNARTHDYGVELTISHPVELVLGFALAFGLEQILRQCQFM